MSVNKVLLIGNVGKEPNVKYYDNGMAVANFSLATSERGYIAYNGTQVPERVEWHNIVAWRSLAGIVEKYIHKGSKIYVEGKIRTRSYEDREGVKRSVTEVWCDNLELLDKNPDSSNGQGNQPSLASVSHTTTQQASQLTSPVVMSVQPIQTNPSLESSEEEDDLPF